MAPASGDRTARTLLVGLGVLLALMGCASSPAPSPRVPVEEPEAVEAQDAPASGSEPRESSRPSPGISVALREESARAAADGDPARAMALLERAIRIEPRRADLWLDLAELHLASGDPAQAALHARRARAMAPGDADVDRRATALEARIRALREAG